MLVLRQTQDRAGLDVCRGRFRQLLFRGLRKVSLWGVLLCLSLFSAAAQVSVNLGWDRSAGATVAGYRLYLGTAPSSYTSTVDLGNVTNYTCAGLSAGTTYYVTVSAYDSNGFEGARCGEISFTPAATSTQSLPPSIALTGPASGSAYSAPASVSLSASVTTNGHTVQSVQFYTGSTLLVEDTALPYAYSWQNVPAGTYSLKARLLYDAGQYVDSAVSSVTVTNVVASSPGTPSTSPQDLPAPWQFVDVGTCAAGAASATNGLFTVAGAGSLSGYADSFRFVYQPLSSDGEVRAQVVSLQSSNANARAGVMIRETLSPGSEYAFMGLAPGGAYTFQRRNSTGGSTSSSTSGSGALPNAWVRLVRSGNSLLGYKSADGTNWSKVTFKTINMAANIYVGLAVASGDTNTLGTAAFTNVVVVP